MLTLYPREARGTSQTGWLDSAHTFSFAGFHDPARMGVGPLRVINEDHVTGGGGFPTHGHRDMEILTFVVSGALAHQDSLGNGSVIEPGDIQLMTAGTGITHSEMNASAEMPVHFFQIWVIPNRTGHAAAYQQIRLDEDKGRDTFVPIATPVGGAQQVQIHQDTRISLARPLADKILPLRLGEDRQGFLQMIVGQARAGDVMLRAGDGIAFHGAAIDTIEIDAGAQLLFFDLPG